MSGFFVLITFAFQDFMIKNSPFINFFVLCIFPVLLFPDLSFAQSKLTDAEILKRKISGDYEQAAVVPANYNTKGIGNFFLTLYQKYISVQIFAECNFNPSCSRYSRLCINKYGLLKGILATGDRLTRCNGFSARDIPDYKFGADELVRELPQ